MFGLWSETLCFLFILDTRRFRFSLKVSSLISSSSGKRIYLLERKRSIDQINAEQVFGMESSKPSKTERLSRRQNDRRAQTTEYETWRDRME